MGRGANSVRGSSAKSEHHITVPDFSKLDEIFGRPKEVDPDAATAEELRSRYQWGGGKVRPNIQAMVDAGKLEQVWRQPVGGQRLIKAWRPVKATKKKGGK